ncbi:transposable element Tc3 transposase [Trichonephila clavipes]|nr:transposable element Tc3 transposase [Trichonephila clavipes]
MNGDEYSLQMREDSVSVAILIAYSSGESGEAAIIPRTSWKGTGRCLAARTFPPVTIRELRLALQDEWAAMPQKLIDTLILSMGRRCETYLAVRGDHIPY